MNIPADTERRLNVHNTFRRRPERLMYVQFTSSVYWDCSRLGKTLERRQWRRFGTFNVNCEYILRFVLIVDFE